MRSTKRPQTSPRQSVRRYLVEDQSAPEFTKRQIDRRVGKSKQSPNAINKQHRMRMDGFKCQVCGRGSEDGVILHVHHIIPASQGGSGDMENLITLCSGCHRSIESGDLENAVTQCVRRAIKGAKRRVAGAKQCFDCKWISAVATGKGRLCRCEDSSHYHTVRHAENKVCIWFDYTQTQT